VRIYVINGSIYENSCCSDSLEEVLAYVAELLKLAPKKTLINIAVREMPEDTFNYLPDFEGFKVKGEVPNDGTD
jgi:hypothetical protein